MKSILPFFILCLFIGTSCSTKTVNKSAPTYTIQEQSSGLIHTVYFWLKDSITNEQKLEFEEALKQLGNVPSIEKYYWGTPAKTAERDVTDGSYDYAINVFFKSIQDEAAYQIDPMHLKFVDGYGSFFERVVVYDNTFGMN